MDLLAADFVTMILNNTFEGGDSSSEVNGVLIVPETINIWCQFNQPFTHRFYAHRTQKCKNDSQVISHFALLGFTYVKAAHKRVGETNPRFLFIGIYGMYQGIQISHPIYAVLFLNLLVQFVSSGISLAAFPVLESGKFVRLSNGNNSLSLLFHCTAWCVTSILRYTKVSIWQGTSLTVPSSILSNYLFSIIYPCQSIHKHGQKLCGVPFLKNFRGS